MPEMHLRLNSIKYNFKQLLQQDNQLYKASRVLQLKKLKHKIYKLLYPLILFTPIHNPITLPPEIFLDLHYKLFQLIHYHTVLQVQTLVIYNIPQQENINSTP